MMNYALQLENLTVRFPGFILGPINLKLPKGRVLAYIGPNGSGKTTTIKTIFGAFKPDDGSVYFSGELISKTKGSRKWINDIGIVTENIFQWENIKAEDYLKFLSKMFDRWDFGLMAKLNDRLKLNVKSIISELSSGDRTKLSVIAAMSHNPSLLLLDEPTSGLDPFARNELMDILFEFMQNEEHSIVYSSHIIPEIDKIADEVAILIDGRVFVHNEKDELIEKWRKINVPLSAVLPESDTFFDVSNENGEWQIISSDYAYSVRHLANAGVKISGEHYMNLESIVLCILKNKKYSD